MALFSFRHSVKTFSDKRKADTRQAARGQTEAHLRYIMRPSAARAVVRERVPLESIAALGREAEEAAQKRKGRVCERFIVALPVEATAAQREALTRAYGDTITAGKGGFLAAIHDKAGNDIANPHFHLVAFDAHEKTGGRGRPRSVIGMARKGAVERAAKEWADLHNRMMREWGYGEASMISHRSNADRGIDRVPTIHEGPGGRAMARQGKTPTAKAEWRAVDDGHTRAQANRVIRQIIQAKEQADEPADRLGGHDDEGGAQRDIRLDERREGRGRRGGDAGRATPPFAGPARTARWAGDAGVGGRPPFAAPEPAAGDRPAPWGCPPLPGRRHRHGGRLRRVYRELVMLRDSLRARLATVEGRRRPLPFIEKDKGIDEAEHRPRGWLERGWER